MPRKGGSLILGLVAALFAVTYWQSRHGKQVTVPGSLKPTVGRDHRPDVDDEALATLVAGNTAFGLDLYRTAAAEHEGNLLLCPYGASITLAMAYAAAEGETATEMAKVCGYGLAQESVPAAFNRLDLDMLVSSTEQARWKSLQAVWTAEAYEVHPSYVDLLAGQFGASIAQADMTQGEAVAGSINAWIRGVTEGQIPELAKPDMFSRLTVLALVNACRFAGEWASPFEEHRTEPQTFRTAGGGKVKADMMHQTGEFGFVETPALKAVELPYVGDQLSLLVVLPAKELNTAFRDSLTPAALTEVLAGLTTQKVIVALPRWSADVTWNLIPLLRQLGIERAFVEGVAEFAMAENAHPHISTAVQRAAAVVNEKGAEMSAATMVVMDDAAAAAGPANPIPEIVCDRPFVYLLRHRPTQSILFIGEVADPTAS